MRALTQALNRLVLHTSEAPLTHISAGHVSVNELPVKCISVCCWAFTWLYQIRCVWLLLWFFHLSAFTNRIVLAVICRAGCHRLVQPLSWLLVLINWLQFKLFSVNFIVLIVTTEFSWVFCVLILLFPTLALKEIHKLLSSVVVDVTVIATLITVKQDNSDPECKHEYANIVTKLCHYIRSNLSHRNALIYMLPELNTDTWLSLA